MRWWHKTLLTGLVILLLLTAGTYWYVQQKLAALPVHNLEFSINKLSLYQLEFGHISFELQQPAAEVSVNDLSLSWTFSGWLSPSLQQIALQSADIKLAQWPSADNSSAPSDDTPFTLPQSWQLPAPLPKQLSVQQLNLQLPCGVTTCQYALSGQATAEQQKLTLQLAGYDTTEQQQRLNLSASYDAAQNLPAMDIQLSVDNSITLNIRQRLTAQDSDNLLTTGVVELTAAPPSNWLQQQLANWQLELPPEALAQFTAPVNVLSEWSFVLPAKPDLANISQHISGLWQFNADLPAPLSIPGVGMLQGQATAAVGFKDGELNRYQINSKLSLQQPAVPDNLKQLGIAADTVLLDISADGASQPQLTYLPLKFAARSTGESQFMVSADVVVNLTPPLSANLKNGNVTWTQPHLTPAAHIAFDKLQLQSQFNAYWLADSWQLDLTNSKLSADKLSSEDNSASKVSLVMPSSQLKGDSNFSALHFKTSIQASAGDVKHALLKSQSWQWQSNLDGTLKTSSHGLALNAKGKLSNAANLGLNHQLSYQNDTLSLEWQLDDVFLLAGNPFQTSFNNWPALLEFNRGRMAASGSLTLADAIAAQATVTLSGVSGIYDRSIFKDLSLPLILSYQGDAVTVSTDNATLAEIQHGVNVGPLKLSASYTTPANTLTAGKLDLAQLQLLAMGGQVTVAPMTLDLALQQQQITLQLDRIDLTKLLQQHPTTDLTGNGLISGTIPLLLNRSGASVQDGYIAAESPGGLLQYRPPGAQNMAATNPGMKVMLNALDDFHYSVLSSNVSYDTNGKLLLALKLHGNNPALEAGRAINLNINLEEDIPALITSLQLSSQISDKIKQRVQQRLQQQSAGKR